MQFSFSPSSRQRAGRPDRVERPSILAMRVCHRQSGSVARSAAIRLSLASQTASPSPERISQERHSRPLDMAQKRVQLLKELPGMVNLAILSQKNFQASSPSMRPRVQRRMPSR